MKIEDQKQLVAETSLALNIECIPEDWTGVDAVLPILERMKAEGAVVIIKLDGGRDRRQYTAVVSGRALGDDYFHIDAETLDEALCHVIMGYANLKWGVAATISPARSKPKYRPA